MIIKVNGYVDEHNGNRYLKLLQMLKTKLNQKSMKNDGKKLKKINK